MPNPWQSRQEMLTDQAMQAAISDPDTIRAIRPVVPQQLLPDMRGVTKQIPAITDSLDLGRYGVSYRSWVSGMPVMQRTFEDGGIDGSGRYSMDSLGNV